MHSHKIYRFDSLDSTNSKALEMAREELLGHGDVVVAFSQSRGKGQRGNQWQAAAGQDLMMSIVVRPENLAIEKAFVLNEWVALVLVDVLGQAFGLDVQVKWPNDIYCKGRKLAGILIENQVRSKFIDQSVIGIGLNVNGGYEAQQQFIAISMAEAVGEKFNLPEVEHAVINELRVAWERIDHPDQLLDRYDQYLLGKGSVVPFVGDDEFEATIIGHRQDGALLVQLPSGLIKACLHHQIQIRPGALSMP